MAFDRHRLLELLDQWEREDAICQQLKHHLKLLVEEQWTQVCGPDEACGECEDMQQFLRKIERLLKGGE